MTVNLLKGGDQKKTLSIKVRLISYFFKIWLWNSRTLLGYMYRPPNFIWSLLGPWEGTPTFDFNF